MACSGGMTLNVGIGVAWPGYETVNFSDPNSVNKSDMVSWRSSLAHQLVSKGDSVSDCCLLLE